MILFVCIQEPSLFAKNEKKTQNNASAKKNKKKSKKGKSSRPKKTDALAQQISLLRMELDSLDKSTSKENIEKLNGWISHLETKVVSKLKHAEASLEKHKAELTGNVNQMFDEDVTPEDMTMIYSEKIGSDESKIATCKELLKVIDQLKTQLNQKTAK